VCPQVPLKRVNQAYVIATSTKVDVSGVDISKFDDGYFKAAEKPREKKGEDEFFKAAESEEKKVGALEL
jgi:large subunit ribosomal protein L6e